MGDGLQRFGSVPTDRYARQKPQHHFYFSRRIEVDQHAVYHCARAFGEGRRGNPPQRPGPNTVGGVLAVQLAVDARYCRPSGRTRHYGRQQGQGYEFRPSILEGSADHVGGQESRCQSEQVLIKRLQNDKELPNR